MPGIGRRLSCSGKFTGEPFHSRVFFPSNILNGIFCPLGPIYTKHLSQCCDNSVIMLGVLVSLKTMQLLQNGVASHFRATPLFSMRTVSLASSQLCRSVYAGAWCKLVLTNTYLNIQMSRILAALATMNSFTLVVMETEPVMLPTSMLCR